MLALYMLSALTGGGLSLRLAESGNAFVAFGNLLLSVLSGG